MRSATKGKEAKTAWSRWLGRATAALVAVAGVGLVAAGQGLAAGGTITVTSVYFDNTPIDHLEGLSYGPTWGTSSPLATFTDSDCTTTCQPATDYTAKILWGDGTPQTSCPGTACAITFASGTYSIAASHTFMDEKNCPVTQCGFTVKVTVTDTVDAVSGSGDNSANLGLAVKDQCLGFLNSTCQGANPTPFSFAATSGVAFSGPIGSFQDANQLAVPADQGGLVPEYSVSIDWGDGSALDTTSGTFTIGTCGTTPGLNTGQGCAVQVSGMHTYLNSNAYTVTMVVGDGLDKRALGGPGTPAFTSTANVANGAGTRCTSANVLPSKTSVAPGSTVVLNAGAGGCSNPQFEYWIGYSNGTWAVLRTWGGPSLSWATNPQASGTYKIHVWANQTGSSTATWEAYASGTVSLGICTSATLAPSAITTPAGMTVAFTGGSTGCANPHFEYWIGYANGTWQVLRTWGTANFNWVTNPLAKGTYTVHIWANNTGDSTAAWEAYASSTVTLT